MDRRRAYESLKRNPKNVRFDDLCRAAETFGFFLRWWKRQSQGLCAAGRHGDTELPERGVGRQSPIRFATLLKVIESCNLLEDDDAA